MKKSFRKILALTPTIAPAIIPTMYLASCGNNVAKEIYDEAIEHFVGKKDGDKLVGGICSIPHNSYELEDIEEYIIDILQKNNVDYKQDLYGNIWFDLPANDEKCKNYKKLCFQAHMDMVWTVDEHKPPLVNNPIPTFDIKDGKKVVHTVENKSSLGADNGVGVAFILSLVTNKTIKHGPIRCILTADEEPGMVGASKIGQMGTGKQDINVVNHLEGFDYLVNIDAETEGDIFVSCAGGYSASYTINNFGEYIENINTEEQTLIRLDVTGGMGGHSGVAMINNPVNAPLLAANIVSANNALFNAPFLRIANIQSYQKAGNVIPGEGTIFLVCQKMYKDVAINTLNQEISRTKTICEKLYPNETRLDIAVRECTSEEYDKYKNYLSDNASTVLLLLLNSLKFGAQEIRVLPDKDELVSSSNVCPIELDLSQSDKQFSFMIFDRSEKEEYLQKEYIDYTRNTFSEACNLLSLTGKIDEKSHYPAYVYKENDAMRNLTYKLYDKYRIEHHDARTHGGIECAWWYKYNSSINQVSIGPTITDVHNPAETLYLETYKNLVKILIDIIGSMGSI